MGKPRERRPYGPLVRYQSNQKDDRGRRLVWFYTQPQNNLAAGNVLVSFIPFVMLSTLLLFEIYCELVQRHRITAYLLCAGAGPTLRMIDVPNVEEEEASGLKDEDRRAHDESDS